MMEVNEMGYMCLICGLLFKASKTKIKDEFGRCICLNCWDKIKSSKLGGK